MSRRKRWNPCSTTRCRALLRRCAPRDCARRRMPCCHARWLGLWGAPSCSPSRGVLAACPAARLPKDLREKVSDSKSNLYFKDLGPKEKESVWDRFREGLQPLQDAGKLGAIVFQFPKWFLPSPASYRFIEDLREWLPDFKIAIEFRQALWLKEERRQRVFELVKGHGLGYVVVDEPQGFGSAVPPVVAVTAPLGMVRFHGHNRENWEKKGISTAEKFRYL